jgi:hypothetical protein
MVYPVTREMILNHMLPSIESCFCHMYLHMLNILLKLPFIEAEGTFCKFTTEYDKIY